MKHSKLKKQRADDKPIFESKLPFEYYIFFGGVIAITLLFTVFIIIGRLDFGSGLFCMVLFNSLLYIPTGRFLARIKLYNNKLEIKYILPWDKSKTYYFDKISDVDKRPDTVFNLIGLLTSRDSLHFRGFKRLYFLSNDKEMVHLRYNISDDSDYELINKLKQIANQNK